MKEVVESDILNNYDYWKRCAEICEIKQITRPEIFKKLNEFNNSPYLISVLKFLEKNSFISVDKDRIPHIININQSKLASFLRGGKPFYQSEILIKYSNSSFAVVVY